MCRTSWISRTVAALAGAVAVALAVGPTSAAAQTTITQWNFDDNTLNPSTGLGTASNVGGSSSAFATGNGGGRAWNTAAYPAQGASSGSAGVQFLFSTLGFQDLSFSFDHRASGTASRWSQVDYTLNGGTDWTTGFWNNNGGLSPHDNFYSFNVDFSGITGANDNADFGVRVVSIFSPQAFNENESISYGANEAYMRANAEAQYQPEPGIGVATRIYASSGTWRFDNVTLSGSPTGAADLVWGGGSGDWNTSASNWTANGTPAVFKNLDTATFSDTAGGTITVDAGGVSPGATVIDATAGTFSFTGGEIGGTGSLTKSGGGTAVLAAANSYSGGTTISGGVLQANSDAALGGGAVTLDGGTLRAGGAITGSRAITVAAGGGTLDTDGNATTVATVTGSGDFTKDGAGTLTVTGGMPGASGGQLSVAAGTLQLNSTGNIDFNVASSGTGFAGDIVLQNAGRIRVTNSGTLGGGGTIFANGNGGTITVTGNGLDVNFANDIVIGDEVSIAIGSTAGNTVTYSGVISGGDGGAGIRFTNSYSGGGGAGTTILSGANIYEGDTRFHNTNSGIVQLAGGNDRLPTGTTLVFGATATHGGSTLDLNGVNQTVAGITNDVRPSVGTITNTSATRSVLTVDGSTTPANPFGGVIAGNLDLVKLGSGTLALTGTSAYGGVTDILGGTLLLDGSVASTELVTVGSGATLGGDGSIAGSLVMAVGANFLFDIAKTLTVDGSSVSFGGFGIANLIGLDASTPVGSYTLIDGLATIDFTNVLNFGQGNPEPLGDGKFAFFRSGSLVVEVVPEPSSVMLAGVGLLAAGYALRRRKLA
jgi:autotransporter-associated beta strand protein